MTALPDPCLLFAYFETTGESGLHLAWSADGLAWEPLHGGASWLRPRVGEAKLMRDPALHLGPDGVFRLVWTTAWEGRTIGYASSRDLREWSEQRALPVMAHEPAAQNCWAPEMIWDPVRRHFLVFWSTTILGRFPETAWTNRRPERNHRIYSTTTTDFESFTPVRLHYDGGFNVIDAHLVEGDGEWLLFVKNEQLTPRTEKNIRLIRAATPDGPFGPPSPPLTGPYWAEGPSAVRVGGAWHLYFDKHQLGAYGLLRSRDLREWEELSDRLSMPRDARHGTVVAVPPAIVAGLLARPPSP